MAPAVVSPPRALLLQIGVRPLLALTLLMAVYLFLRGHNLPGGGFVAGLVAALALVTQYLADDFRAVTARLTLDYPRWMAAGLLLIAITGALSMVLGYPFLTSAFVHVQLPLLGDFELASAMAFDLGVFLVVIATVLAILLSLGDPGREAA
jgi:multicomponent K+:H+ antiporter subunit A